MFAVLGLIALGFVIVEIVDGSSRDADTEVLSDSSDVLVDETYRDAIETSFLDLVNEGEITPAESEQALDLVDFRSGALDVDTAGGDDVVLAGDTDDSIEAGEGSDFVIGGAGNDMLSLGAGDDVSGVDDRVVPQEDDSITFPTLEESTPLGEEEDERQYEGGDDSILGGTGDDLISDSYGRNFVNGQQGDDVIVTVDAADDTGTPDVVKGGFGFDTLVVDEGDIVETGRGFDTVVLDVLQGVEGDYTPIEITDFGLGKDALVIEGDADLIGDADDITVRDLADGSGAEVLIGDVPVMIVHGAAGLTADDVAIVLV